MGQDEEANNSTKDTRWSFNQNILRPSKLNIATGYL